MPFLYHYTTPRGLLGIIDSRTLWATHIRYLNDATEYVHALDVAWKLTEEMDLNADEIRLFGYLLSGATRDELSDVYGQSDDIFVASLSGNPDRLSQWRAYAGRNGYCIGWDEAALRELARANEFELQQCEYRVSHQRELILPVLQKTLDRWRADPLDVRFHSPEGRHGGPDGEKIARLVWSFYGEFERVATICKNPAFEEEQEWRLISLSAPKQPRKLQFREGKSVLISYVLFSLQFNEFGLDDPLVQVYCGPNPEPNLAVRSLEKLLLSRGWEVYELNHSRVPHRDW